MRFYVIVGAIALMVVGYIYTLDPWMTPIGFALITLGILIMFVTWLTWSDAP